MRRVQAMLAGGVGLVLVLAAACDDERAVTGPEAGPAAGITIAAKPAGPSITAVDGGGAFELDAAPVLVTVTVTNPGRSSVNGASVLLRVSQESSVREIGSAPVTCDGTAPGTLPGGAVCDVVVEAAVSAAGAGGAITAGTALFEAVLQQASGKKAKTLDVVSEEISLTEADTPPQGIEITNVVLGSSSLYIDGPGVSSGITIYNGTGSSIGGASLQAFVRQVGGATRAAGGTSSLCSVPGTLPPEECVTNSLAPSASNSAEGTGTLVPGPAELVIELREAPNVVHDTWVEVITLLEMSDPAIVSLELASTQLELEGAPVDYTVTISNDGPPRSITILNAELRQGEASRGAGGTEVQCEGEASGVLPTGGCTFDFYAGASNLPGGTSTFMEGNATLRFQLAVNDWVADELDVAITLTSNGPYLGNVTLGSNQIELGGASVSVSVPAINPRDWVYEPVQVVARIRQISGHRFAGQDEPNCSPFHRGELGPGTCVIGFSVVANNGNAGDGFLDEGPADLELVLRNTSSDTLDIKLIPITITRN